MLLLITTPSAYVALRPPLLGAHPTPAVSSQTPIRVWGATSTPRLAAPRLSFDLGASYLTALHEHYYATASLQAFPLVSIGDLGAQLIERREADKEKQPIDLGRALQMGMLGALISGLGTATWLRFLEDHVHTVSDLPLWLYEPVLRVQRP